MSKNTKWTLTTFLLLIIVGIGAVQLICSQSSLFRTPSSNVEKLTKDEALKKLTPLLEKADTLYSKLDAYSVKEIKPWLDEIALIIQSIKGDPTISKSFLAKVYFAKGLFAGSIADQAQFSQGLDKGPVSYYAFRECILLDPSHTKAIIALSDSFVGVMKQGWIKRKIALGSFKFNPSVEKKFILEKIAALSANQVTTDIKTAEDKVSKINVD